MTDLFDGLKGKADPFGKACIGIMDRCMKLGGGEENMRRAMVEEIEDPTFDDKEFRSMLVNLQAGGDGVSFAGVTYRCPKCKDRSTATYEDPGRGFVIWQDKETGIHWSRYCDCSEGQKLRQGHIRSDEKARRLRERRGRRGLRPIAEDEQLP